MSTFVNIEILQTLPFSNANRDDSGQPKTVGMGGTTRGRLSSQSLKRAARFYGVSPEKGFGINGDNTGGQFFRTRYLERVINDEITKRGLDPKNYNKQINDIFGKQLGKGKKDKDDVFQKVDSLIVLTLEEIEKLTDAIIKNELDSKKISEILTNSSKRDLALWGRFFASGSNETIDGSAQVAHAFTTHSVRIEDDFFVGLDDLADLYANHAGAGHPGDAFYLTGVFYKYANANIEETILNMGNATMTSKNGIEITKSKEEILEDTNFAISDFINSFVRSVPQGKIRSTAHTTPPNYIRVYLTKDSPVNGAIAFENAVKGANIMNDSIEILEKTHSRLNDIFGGYEKDFVINLNDTNSNLNLQELIENVKKEVSEVVDKTCNYLNEKEVEKEDESNSSDSNDDLG